MTKYDVKFWIWAIITLAGAVYVGVRMTDDGKPYYQAVADSQERHCVWTKGDHRWRASLGMSLEMYCKADGLGKALAKQCYDHPEGC